MRTAVNEVTEQIYESRKSVSDVPFCTSGAICYLLYVFTASCS